MTLNHNKIVVDLNKVQYAKFYYRNQFGNTIPKLPDSPTHRAVKYPLDEIVFNPKQIDDLRE